MQPFYALPCSERGGETVKHFLFDIAGMTGDWKMEDVLEEEMEKIRVQVRGGTSSTWLAVQGWRCIVGRWARVLEEMEKIRVPKRSSTSSTVKFWWRRFGSSMPAWGGQALRQAAAGLVLDWDPYQPASCYCCPRLFAPLPAGGPH